MGQQLLDGGLIGGTEHYQAKGVAGGFTDYCGVGVVEQYILKLLIDRFTSSGHGCETKTEADAMLNCFVLAAVTEPFQKVVNCILIILVSMNQPICIVSSSSGVR